MRAASWASSCRARSLPFAFILAIESEQRAVLITFGIVDAGRIIERVVHVLGRKNAGDVQPGRTERGVEAQR